MTSSCCVSGTIHDGVPMGREIVMHGLPCYVTYPPSSSTPSISDPSPSQDTIWEEGKVDGMEKRDVQRVAEKDVKGVVVIMPDAIGWKFTNTRCLADEMARMGGWMVVVPEVMGGHGLPQSIVSTFDGLFAATGFWATLKKPFHLIHLLYHLLPFQYHTRLSLTSPRTTSFLTSLRLSLPPSTPLASAGYCWGGPHTIHLASLPHPEHPQRTLLDAAFVAHPAPVSPSAIANIHAPFSMVVGDKDMVLPLGQVEEWKRVLGGREDMEGRWEVQVFRGARHGFAVRGDPGDEGERRRGVEAREGCVGWFQRWFNAAAAAAAEAEGQKGKGG